MGPRPRQRRGAARIYPGLGWLDEIVGVAGVSGNGQRQMIEVLAGQRDASGGEVRIAGEVYHATREEMRARGWEPMQSQSVE